MTPCHNQWRHETLAKQHHDQDPVRRPSRGPVNIESSFQHQGQSTVRWCWGAELMPLQEQPRPCQLFEWIPCFTASSRWSRIRVSASSWVHGARPNTSRDWVHSPPVWHVLMTCLSVAMVAALVAKNENNSILLSLMRRNSFQFPGIVLDGSTRRRIPFPLRVRVSAYKLSAIYSSHTTIYSVHVLQLRCDVRQEHLGRVIGKCLCKTRSKRVNDCSPIKHDNLYDRSGGKVLCRNEIFQAADQIRFCSCPQFPNLW